MAAKEPIVERRHRLLASELVNKVAAAWVGNPAATFGLSTREVDLLTRAAQLLANAEAAAAAKAVEPFVLLRDWQIRTSFGEVSLPQRWHDGTFRMYATVPGKTPVIGQGTDVSAAAYELCRVLGLLPSEPAKGDGNGG